MNNAEAKKKIQQRFSLASRSYDTVATIQKKCAYMLITKLKEMCPDFYPSSILDLGTGTGYLPELLLPHFPNSLFTLNDLSPDMLLRAREKICSSRRIPYVSSSRGLTAGSTDPASEGDPWIPRSSRGTTGKFQYQLGDIETTEFAFHELVVSNLALQWMTHLEATLQAFYLNSNVMAFSCLLDGTFQEWAELLQCPPLQSYPSGAQLESYLTSLQPADYSYTTHEFRMTFSGARAFMFYLKQLGASVGQVDVPLADLKQLIQRYHQPFDVTYRVFFGVLKRS